MQTKIMERYFFFGLFFCSFVFTFMVFRPFWIVLVLGISFSIILHPVFKWLTAKKLPNWLASLMTVIFFVIVLCVPIGTIGSVVLNQTQDLYQNVIATNNTGRFLTSVDKHINKVLPKGMTFNINTKVEGFISFVSNNIAQIFTTTFSTIFSFFLVLLSIFYFLKDSGHWQRSIFILSPLSEENDEKIIRRLVKAINGVMVGSLLIAILQGTLMGIGLAIFGVPHPALWGVIAFVSALIPLLSTFPVSIPSIIFLFIIGNTGHAIGLLVWTVLMVAFIDNFLSPIVISKRADMPPLLILFSLLGGITLYGPVGILIGPLSLSLLYALISIYKHEYRLGEIS